LTCRGSALTASTHFLKTCRFKGWPGVAVAVAAAWLVAASAGWLNFGGDPLRRWFVNQPLPEKPALLKAVVAAPPMSGLFLSPLLIGNTLYTFSSRGGVLSAIDLTSLELVWQKKFPDSKLANQKGFSSDGNLILVPFGFTGKVVAISAKTGEIAWSFNVGANEVATGNVFYRGLFVFATDKGRVFALDPEGQLVWSRNLEEPLDWFTFVPVVSDSGVIVNTLNGTLYILNWEKGEIAYRGKTPGKGASAVSVLADGSLIIAYQTEAGIGISNRRPDGKTVWDSEVSLPASAPPGVPVVGGGRIFVPAGNSVLVFLEDGKLQGKWTLEEEATVFGLLAFNDGAVVSFRSKKSTRGSLAFVDAQTWGIRARFEGEGQFFTPPVYYKGTVIAPNEDGRVYIYR
jgi:outer membrane protein assembly factor BamB